MTVESLRGRKIGFSQWTTAELFTDIVNAMRQEASLHGIEVGPILDAQGEIAGQMAQADAFLSLGVDGFVIVSATTDWDDLVRRAVDRGIYVFTYNVGPTTGATMNIFKRPGGGRALGQAAAKWINDRHEGKAEFATLVFTTAPSLRERSQAMKRAVLENAPNATLIGEIEAATIPDGARAARTLLEAHPNLKAIVCFNDDGALGAYAAVTETGKRDPNEFWIGGFDGTQAAVEKIAEGGIYQATISFFVKFSAVQLMRDMVRCLRGERVPPTREIAFQLITPENVEEHQRLIADPLAPDAQYLYDEIIVYMDEPLTTAAGYLA